MPDSRSRARAAPSFGEIKSRGVTAGVAPLSGPPGIPGGCRFGPAPNAGPPMGDFPVLLDLPRTLDRLWGTFPSYDAIGRLEAPMDFMNSVGVLLPMELWGRCVLYSCLNASAFYLERRPMTRTSFDRCTRPELSPLNASIKLLSVGLPGLEKSSVTPFM